MPCQNFLRLLLSVFFAIVITATPLAAGDSGPEPIDLPSDPIERAALVGLATSFQDSAMWQVQKAQVLSTAPTLPNAAFLEKHDPKELYCVCVEFEVRYKVEWTTTEPSPWKRTVRNILVIKTQSDHFMALKPMNICSPFCQ